MQPRRSRSTKPSSMLDLHSDDKTLNGLAYSEESKETIPKSILPSRENSPRIDSSIRSERLSSLPAYKVMLPFSVTSSEIVDAFTSCAQKRKFQIVERTGSVVTAVLQPVKTWKSFLINCLPIQSSSSSNSNQITSIRLHIALNERKCMRTVLAKGLSGHSGYILPLLQEFKGRLDKLETMNRSPMRAAQDKLLHNRQISTEMDEEPEVTCSSEATSYYQFYKLLSSESYTLGRSLAEFFESFSNQYRNIQESFRLLPQPVR